MKHIIMLMAMMSLLTGCITTLGAESTMQTGAYAIPEKVFDGVYKGSGVRVDIFGNAKYTFESTMKAYSENGAVYMQETLVDNAGIKTQYTYRFIKRDNKSYSCVDISDLGSCSLTRSGDSIVLKNWIWEKGRSDAYNYNIQSVYQLLPDGKIIKRSSLNRFMFFFDEEEITAYQKEL
ncbi:DUF3833 family protein [Seleniivibrio woodruffii]|uniref:DUF3833 family protein n=1 Tax=Seleniivibrio woodruffii TaxID=1078050 RepID=UPI0026F25A67|nr:DUF3833 family protein [Seleniivibrio woodruffii]